MQLKFEGKIIGKKFEPKDPSSFLKAVNNLEGKDVSMSIGEHKNKKPRSDEQNRYYWGVVIEILSNELGYEKDQMHDIIKWKFLKCPVNISEDMWSVRSTTDLSTSQFEDLMTKIRSWASINLGIFIPDPNNCVY